MSEFDISPLSIPSGESQSEREDKPLNIMFLWRATMIFGVMIFFLFTKQLRGAY